MDETPEQKAAREAKEREAAARAAEENKTKSEDDKKEKAELLAEIARLREGGRASKAKAEELQAKLDEINANTLKEQGKYKDLYEKSEADKKTLSGDWRKKYVKSLTRAEAVAAGIQDSDLAMLINVDDLLDDDLDEGELVEKIRDKVSAHKQKKPVLYKPAGKPGREDPEEEEEEEEEEEPTLQGGSRNTGSRQRQPAPAGGDGKPRDVRKMPKDKYLEERTKHLKKIAKSQPRRYS